MAFLGWIGVTGVLLAIDSMSPPGPLEEAPGVVQASAPMQVHAALEMFRPTIAEALAHAPPEVDSVDVQLQSLDGRTVIAVAFGNDGSARYYDALTGSFVAEHRTTRLARWLNDIPARLRVHNFLQDLHRGSIIGIPGQVIDVLSGFCFIFLGVSGTIMYLQVLMRRRRLGKKALFWR